MLYSASRWMIRLWRCIDAAKRCSNAASWLASTLSREVEVGSRCSVAATYSRTAFLAASCMDIPSSAARARKAACSSSVSLSVIAMA